MNQELPFNNPLPEAKLAIQAAIKAGKEVMSVYEKDFSTTIKNDKEPLIEADIKSNEIILKTISSLGHPFRRQQ